MTLYCRCVAHLSALRRLVLNCRKYVILVQSLRVVALTCGTDHFFFFGSFLSCQPCCAMNNHGTTNNKKMEPSPTNTSARPASTRRPLSLAARQYRDLMRANGMKGPLMKTTPIAPTSVHHTKHTRSRTANSKKTTSRSAKPSSSRTAKRKAGKAKTITVTYWTHTDPSSSPPRRITRSSTKPLVR